MNTTASSDLSDSSVTLSERILFATVQLQCVKSDGVHRGTGFIYGFHIQGDIYVNCIITNKHVINNSINIFVRFKRRIGRNLIHDAGKLTELNFETSSFVNHPEPGVDLAAITLPNILTATLSDGSSIGFTAVNSDTIPKAEQIDNISAFQEVSMIGYPKGLSDDYHNLPIVRRGHLALPYKYNFKNRPEFVVDISAIYGSSGSPVFVINEGLFVDSRGLNSGNRLILLGVLWGGEIMKSDGSTSRFEVPTSDSAIFGSPINIGYCVKSSEIERMRETVLDVARIEGRIS